MSASILTLASQAEWLRAAARGASLALAGTLIPLALEWIARGRNRRSTAGVDALTYPRAFADFGLCWAVAPWLVAFVLLRDHGDALAEAAIFSLASLPGLYLFAESRVTLFQLSPEGIHARRLFRKRAFLGWSDVRRVERSQRGVSLEGATRGLKIALALQGMPVFAQSLLRRVPEAQIAPEALALLRQLVEGELPPRS